MNYRDKIRKSIECPEFGNSSYGAWGSLRIDQRRNIKRLLDELDGADDYIKKLYEENTRLVNEITVLKTENQKLKEMQCTFLGTGCQNKMKKYKEVIDKVNKLIAENSEKYWIDDEGEPKYLFNEIRDILSEVE